MVNPSPWYTISLSRSQRRLECAGFDAKAEDKEREARMLEVTKVKTVDEIRAEMDQDPLPDGLGEIILDPTFLQWVQGKQGMEQEGEGGFGEDGEGEAGEGGGDGFPDWFGGSDKDKDKDGDKDKGKDGPPGAKETASGKDLPSGVKGGKGGQKEALAASLDAIRTVEVLRKSQRVQNDRQIIDVEIVGE